MDKPFLTDFLGADNDQRRKHERKPYHAPGQLLVADKRIIDIRIVDISLGGMAVIAPFNPPHASLCVVRFALRNSSETNTTLLIRSAVTHSIFSSREDGFKVGLVFRSLSDDAQSVLRQFLDG